MILGTKAFNTKKNKENSDTYFIQDQGQGQGQGPIPPTNPAMSALVTRLWWGLEVYWYMI